MNDLVTLTIKIDRKRKELFSKLAQEEEIGLTQAIKELMDEAIARGYINKERKERLQKLMMSRNQ
jgi:hypothetical protein